MKAFYIDRETHYKQHEFLGDLMKYAETCKFAFYGGIVIFVGSAFFVVGQKVWTILIKFM